MERLTVRVSDELNIWLNERSEKTGLSKSALVCIAVENYKKEQDTLNILPELVKQIEKLKVLGALDGFDGKQ